jgi:hypothetical protein
MRSAPARGGPFQFKNGAKFERNDLFFLRRKYKSFFKN